MHTPSPFSTLFSKALVQDLLLIFSLSSSLFPRMRVPYMHGCIPPAYNGNWNTVNVWWGVLHNLYNHLALHGHKIARDQVLIFYLFMPNLPSGKSLRVDNSTSVSSQPRGPIPAFLNSALAIMSCLTCRATTLGHVAQRQFLFFRHGGGMKEKAQRNQQERVSGDKKFHFGLQSLDSST